MEKTKASPRQQFLEETENEQRSVKIRSNKAWLNTQRMLKRSGKVYLPVLPKEMENVRDGTFDFDTVQHLYLLQLAAGQIKSFYGFSSWVEICELQIRQPHAMVLPTSHIIVPTFIRRKVHAFVQDAQPIKVNSDDCTVQKSKLVGEFSGGLYAVMCRVHKLKSCADKMIASLPVTRDEMRLNSIMNVGSYRIVGSAKSPSFMLLLLECKRLGYNNEYDRLLGLRRIITNDTQLNMLGNALFFAFLYLDKMKTDAFSAFFTEQAALFDSSPQQRKSKIEQFISHIYENYLYTAKKRIFLRERLSQW